MKKYLVAGLIILIPLAITFFLMVFLIDFFTEPFLNMVRSLLETIQEGRPHPFSPKGITLLARTIIILLLFLFIFFLGVVARWFFFRSLLDATNRIFSTIPFVRTIYKTCRDVAKALFSSSTKVAFKHTAIVPFPCPQSYSIGFVTGEVPKICSKELEGTYIPVLIPTAPHPISGILMFVPEKEIHTIEMTNEEGLKFILSCGLILPETKKDSYH